jgi:hypothetical protein
MQANATFAEALSIPRQKPGESAQANKILLHRTKIFCKKFFRIFLKNLKIF